MRLTHLGHACLLVEIADTRILIDPGSFTPAWEQLRDVDAVLVTHQHPDHLDQDRLPDLLRRNAGIPIHADPDSVAILRDKGIGAAVLSEPLRLGPVTVTPAGELHALINPAQARIHNTGLRLDADGEPSLFHPGDALDADPGPVDVLAFPLNAPWARARDTADFVKRFDAPTAFPIHDGLLTRQGRKTYLTHVSTFGAEHTQIRDLSDGEPVAL